MKEKPNLPDLTVASPEVIALMIHMGWIKDPEQFYTLPTQEQLEHRREILEKTRFLPPEIVWSDLPADSSEVERVRALAQKK